jgi:prepilin-type N-terminal cleavage/methylation domain-containing protein
METIVSSRPQLAVERGFTLIEILMVVVVLGILSAVAMRSVQTSIEATRIEETQAEMDQLTHAIAGNPDLVTNGRRSDFGYVGDVGALPSSLDDLVSNPGGYSTWKGPYLHGRFAEDGEAFKRDAWGNLYTYTDGITISSSGGGATPMTTSAASAATDLVSTAVVGTIKDAGSNPPGDSAVAVAIRVDYPDGAGGTTSAMVNPAASGSFGFSGIPVGTRQFTAVYRATNDSGTSFAAVLPATGGIVTVRLPGAPFAATGGASGGAQIQFVTGSASSPSNDVRFSIWNTGTSAVSISSLQAIYTLAAYYRYIYWDGTVVFDSNNPRAGSGQVVAFSSGRTLAAGQALEIRLGDFKASVTGGSNVQMNNVVFTSLFSNGQSLAFNSM